VFKVELKKIARLTKKIELVSKHIKKTKQSITNENVKQHRFQLYHQIDRIDFDAFQNAIQSNNRDDDRDRNNYKKRDKKDRDDKLDNDTN
jgi:protein subunit release factor B